MQYLADKTPGQTLLPTDARGRAANLRTWLGRVQELEAWKRTAPPAPPG
jgi:glutathione S-transferase